MVNSLSAISPMPRLSYHRLANEPVVVESGAEGHSQVKSNSVRPQLVSVVNEINSAVLGLAHDLRIELDLGPEGLGARITDKSGGRSHPIPLEYATMAAGLIKQTAADERGGLVNEKA
ncbi:MAG: hypothetical protein EPN21_12425 [Methylococcaceae bacterium]|nr:MAG: hypothetical protein EPN21_12425 [Methylococcaceae bacterium]